MGRVIYSDKKIEEFIELAQEIGMSPAMRQLEYPAAYGTALRWFKEKGAGLPEIDSLLAKAAEMKKFYGDAEKKLALQTLIDRIVEKLMQDDLSADDINKLASSLSKAITSFNLVEGKATSVSENRQKDGTDLSIMDMLNSAKARNELVEQDLA